MIKKIPKKGQKFQSGDKILKVRALISELNPKSKPDKKSTSS